MKKNLLLIFFINLALLSESQIVLKLGNVENATPGTFINVPLVVSGLSVNGHNFIGLEMVFAFQESVLFFDSLANGNAQTPLSQWIAGTIPGKVSANWLEPSLNPINVEDNSVLVEFVFLYTGGHANLDFDPASTFVYDSEGNALTISELISGQVTQAQGSDNSVWNGTGIWTTAANWSNGIPGGSTNAIINSGTVNLANGGICRNFSINPGAKLIIEPGYSLTVNGDYVNDGEILIESDSLIQGSLITLGQVTQNGISRMAFNVYNGLSYLVGSPVQNANEGVLNAVGSAYVYSEPSGNWNSLPSGAELLPGTGFKLNAIVSSQVIYSGPYNYEQVNINLSFTSQSSAPSVGWNLVCNPYSSSFATDQHLITTNADRAIYVWDGIRFRVWNGVAGSIPGGVIPPATAFFVRASNQNASLDFSVDGKLHDFSHFNGSYNLPANVLKIEVSNLDLPKLKDEAFLQIESTSTPGYDGAYDVFKLMNNNGAPEIFLTDSGGEKYAIATIPEAYESLVGVSLPADGTYKVNAVTASFLPEKPVYLIDQTLEITKDLRSEDYVFQAPAGDYPDRFKIVLTGLGIRDLPEDPGVFAYSKQARIYIMAQKDLGRSSIMLYDMSGKLIAQCREVMGPGRLISLPGASGLNIVRVETETTSSVIKIFNN